MGPGPILCQKQGKCHSRARSHQQPPDGPLPGRSMGGGTAAPDQARLIYAIHLLPVVLKKKFKKKFFLTSLVPFKEIFVWIPYSRKLVTEERKEMNSCTGSLPGNQRARSESVEGSSSQKAPATQSRMNDGTRRPSVFQPSPRDDSGHHRGRALKLRGEQTRTEALGGQSPAWDTGAGPGSTTCTPARAWRPCLGR